MIQIFPVKAFRNELICLAAALTVCLSGIFGHDLWTPDEPRAASIVLEMANTNNYVIPRLAGVPFVEKPPLYFASAAVMLKLLGPLVGNTGAIRFTTALFGLGVLLMTFLISRKLWNVRTALLSVMVLTTMEGFVENFHWIRVDAALSFFVIASVWCFVEVYCEDRLVFLPLAGLFLGGSFLSKGLIGPVLIAVPWAGLAAWRLFVKEGGRLGVKPMMGYHLLALLIFIMISGTWVFLLYVRGGPSLWYQWFWINHVARFTGSAAAKGHIRSGHPFYYVLQLLCYGMPWIFMVLCWLGRVTRNLIKQQRISRNACFLYVWGVGSLVLLSLPATKRGIYLAPVLPAYAIMTAVALRNGIPGWFKRYINFWTGFCLILIALITLAPLAGSLIPDTVPMQIKMYVSHFNYCNVFSCILFVLCLAMILGKYRDALPLETRMVFVTACVFITLMGSPMKAIDLAKSMSSDVQHFVSKIPESERDRIAGVGFSETMQGAFYYYTNWRVPKIRDMKTINDIMSGHHAIYNSLIVNKRHKSELDNCLPGVPHRVILKTITGNDRRLYWIKSLAVSPGE